MQSIVTSVVPPERAGRAIATVVSGLTFATLLGVPLGAMIGQRFGWRAPFAAFAIIALAGGIILAASMPRTPTPPTGIRGELRVLARRPVLLAIATTAIGFAGVGTVLTYIVPLLTQVTGFATTVVSALLLAYGGGSVLGNLAAGRPTDISLTMTLRIVFIGLAVVLAVLPFAATWRPTDAMAVLGLGLLSTAAIAPLQGLILRHAAEAPTLSVAVNVSGFNLANALGSAIGGGMVAAGALRWNGLAGAALAVIGLGVSYLAILVRRPRRTSPDARHSDRPPREFSSKRIALDLKQAGGQRLLSSARPSCATRLRSQSGGATMSFTQIEVDYLTTQRLGRLATVQPDGRCRSVRLGSITTPTSRRSISAATTWPQAGNTATWLTTAGSHSSSMTSCRCGRGASGALRSGAWARGSLRPVQRPEATRPSSASTPGGSSVSASTTPTSTRTW
jgi:MFS family permease